MSGDLEKGGILDEDSFVGRYSKMCLTNQKFAKKLTFWYFLARKWSWTRNQIKNLRFDALF